MILPEFAGDEEYSRMFLDEANVASAVQHPNVCEVYQLGRDPRTLYMAMEWVVGAPLSNVLKLDGVKTPLPLPVAARIVADACAGLHAAHEAKDAEGHPLNIIHRDISPHNILVSVDGSVKLADFGVAKARAQLHSRTKTGQLKGKISFVAPEQLTNQSCDARIDVFAMGCVLYEATLGRNPFTSKHEVDTLRKIVRGEYNRPRDENRDFPPDLQDIIVQALEISPSRRFASADAMRMALEEWLLREKHLVTAETVALVVRERVGKSVEVKRAEVRAASKRLREISNSGVFSDARLMSIPAPSPSDSQLRRADLSSTTQAVVKSQRSLVEITNPTVTTSENKEKKIAILLSIVAVVLVLCLAVVYTKK
jgi:serine/threonine-protein kinase